MVTVYMLWWCIWWVINYPTYGKKNKVWGFFFCLVCFVILLLKCALRSRDVHAWGWGVCHESAAEQGCNRASWPPVLCQGQGGSWGVWDEHRGGENKTERDSHCCVHAVWKHAGILYCLGVYWCWQSPQFSLLFGLVEAVSASCPDAGPAQCGAVQAGFGWQQSCQENRL